MYPRPYRPKRSQAPRYLLALISGRDPHAQQGIGKPLTLEQKLRKSARRKAIANGYPPSTKKNP